MTSIGKVFTYPNNPSVHKAVIVGKYVGVTFDQTTEFKMGTENKTPEFLAMNPFGQVPTLSTPEGPLFESNAIARYVARKSADAGLILGKGAYEESVVDQWIEALRSNDSILGISIGYVLRGFLPYDENKWNSGTEQFKKVLNALNQSLEGKEWLVGGRVTLADIAWGIFLKSYFENFLHLELRQPYPNVVAWFQRFIDQPIVKEVLGGVNWCSAPAQPKKN